MFLDQVRVLVNYWTNSNDGDVKNKVEGVAFSILSAIDGSGELPGFMLAPRPHESDKEYYIENCENYFPTAPDVDSDIAGSLHEEFYKHN